MKFGGVLALSNELEQTYLDFLQYILDNGVKKEDDTSDLDDEEEIEE